MFTTQSDRDYSLPHEVVQCPPALAVLVKFDHDVLIFLEVPGHVQKVTMVCTNCTTHSKSQSGAQH